MSVFSSIVTVVKKILPTRKYKCSFCHDSGWEMLYMVNFADSIPCVFCDAYTLQRQKEEAQYRTDFSIPEPDDPDTHPPE